jgi:transcriptional regulator with XRE-family HTH domain
MAKKPGKNELLSLTQLASRLHLNRNTLSRKLSGLKSVSGPKGARLYPVAEVAALLDEAKDPKLVAARRRKLEAEAGLAELKLQKERGDLVSHRDVLEDLTALIRDLYNRLAVAMPQQLAPRLQAKTARQAEDLLRTEMAQVFAELRAEHVQYLAEWDAAEGGAPGEAHCG